MKKIIFLICVLAITFTLQAQNIRTFGHLKNGTLTKEIIIQDIDSITFSGFTVPNNSTGVLINGVVWATCNVDAPGVFASKPSDPGMFYQWNRNMGWSVTDPVTNSDGATIWDDSDPVGDNWEAANNPCPSGWRVPTPDEQQSLLDAGGFWNELNGVPGYFFGNGKEKVFFPAAGYRYCDGVLYPQTTYSFSYYWSDTSTYGSYYEQASAILFNSTTLRIVNSSYYCAGYSVRCVAE